MARSEHKFRGAWEGRSMSRFRNGILAVVVVVILAVVWMGSESKGQGPKAKSSQWEYTWEIGVHDNDTNEDIQKATKAWNKLGAQGWELCALDRGVAVFKRPKR
jgi:hypothetical protein